MHRTGFRMRLKPGCEATYKEKHGQIWPESLEVRRSQWPLEGMFWLEMD